MVAKHCRIVASLFRKSRSENMSFMRSSFPRFRFSFSIVHSIVHVSILTSHASLREAADAAEDSAVPPKTVQSGDENRSVSKPIVDAYGKGNKEIFETVCILTRGASKTKSSKDLIMGVTKKILREGDGETFPKKGHRLTMNYVGTLASNGKKFDASRDHGRPFSFKVGVGEVIQGWDEGIMQMSLGEKAELQITSDYAYGRDGAGDVIPPNADLVFEVELLQIGNKVAPVNSMCCIIQ